MTDELESPIDDDDREALRSAAEVLEDDPTVRAIIAPELKSARLKLRPPRVEDAAAIVRALNDVDIAKMTATIPHPYALSDAYTWIDTINRSWLGRLSGTETVQGGGFVIELKTAKTRENAVIGAVGVRDRGEPSCMELGYWIARDHWGHGYATEAAQTIVDWAFTAYRVNSIRGRYRPINPASARVLVKCGFQPEGSELSTSVVAGQILVNTCRLERDVWRSLRRWAGGTPVLPTEVL